jgi:hypothetical protein
MPRSAVSAARALGVRAAYAQNLPAVVVVLYEHLHQVGAIVVAQERHPRYTPIVQVLSSVNEGTSGGSGPNESGINGAAEEVTQLHTSAPVRMASSGVRLQATNARAALSIHAGWRPRMLNASTAPGRYTGASRNKLRNIKLSAAK